MATNIFDYANASPALSPSPSASSSPLLATPPATNSTSPNRSPAPNSPAAASLWGGHVKPAEVQIIVIVLIAGLFNAFFLTLSLRLLWRRYQHGPIHNSMQPPPPSTVPPDIESHICRVTPMLVRQPDDQLVYGLKQVLRDEPNYKQTSTGTVTSV